MPAVCTWTGATGDGNLATAGNWLGGAAPVNGDDAVWDRGNYDVTAGLSPGTNLVNLRILPTYGGKWASAVTWGTITTAYCAGSGSVYNFGGTVTTAYVYIPVGSMFIANSGTWTTTSFSGGGNWQVTGATLTNIYSTNVGGYLGSSAGVVTLCEFANGSLTATKGTLGSSITTLTSSGRMNLTVQLLSQMGTVNLAYGDVYNHQSTGAITLLKMKPYSMFPCSGAFGDFTITTLEIWPNTTINRHPPGVTVTISTETARGFSSGGASGSPGA